MVKSMTAYGRGECEYGKAVYIAELKSLNNRYRDIILRLPGSLQGIEEEIRAIVSSKVRRGRVEVTIQVEKKSDETNYKLELNLPLIKSYLKVYEELIAEMDINERPNPEYLLQLKDSIIMRQEETDLDEALSALREVFDLALDSLDKMRLQEGRAIEEDFSKRLAIIEDCLKDIEKRAPFVVEEYKVKLEERISRISEEIEVDENRLSQEVAIFAGRCDITEELLRVKSHLGQFRTYLKVDDSIGRRLDFLVQEMNREINTISSKASDSSISYNAVEIKAELEKLREQIQNVE